jgi:hypothetical protein
MVMKQMAALTTQSQQMAHTAAKTSASVAAAINKLAANQQTMQQQFAVFTMQCNTTYQWTQVVQPPITQILIPNFASFSTEGCGGGRRGGSRHGGHANFWAHQGPQHTHLICRLCWTWRTMGPAPHKRRRRTRWQSAPFCATTHAVQRGSTVLQHT